LESKGVNEMATEQERLDKLENDMIQMNLRMTLAESNIKEMGKKLDKIEGNTGKIIWILVSAIILAVLNMIIRGGVSL
jgi:hypothetical protein